MSKRHNIDDLFRDGLQGHQTPPPKRVWDKLGTQLPTSLPWYKQPLAIYGSVAMLTVTILLIATNYHTIQSVDNQKSITSSSIKNNKAITTNPKIKPLSSITNKTKSDKTQATMPSQTAGVVSSIIGHKSVAATNHQINKTERNNISTSKKSVIQLAKASINFPKIALAEKPIEKSIPIKVTQNPVTNRSSHNLAKKQILSNQENSLSNTIPSSASRQSKLNIHQPTVTSILLEDRLPSLPPAILATSSNVETALATTKQEIPILSTTNFTKQLNQTTGLQFGAFFTPSNTWILNQNALDATVDNSKINYKLDFGTAYGWSLGYDFSPRYGIQVEWILKSKQGQVFNYLQENFEQFNTTNINLTYTHFPILFKYRFNKYSTLTKQPMILNCLLGVQYGLLKTAEININNPVIQANLLQRGSWGIVAGFNYDIYLTANYSFSIGARGSISTPSASITDVSILKKQEVYNALLGVQMSLNYRFKH